MPPLRKSKRKSTSELLHMRDSPRCQSFLVDVPLPMDGSHIFTSTTKRGNQMTSKSGMLPPRKSKKYRGDEYAKEVQATQQLTTQETSHERIMSTSQPTSSSSTYIESSLYDIYRLQEIIRDETGKEDHGGYCRGLGSGVTRRRLSHPFGTFQTLTQSHINQMREDVNHAREDVDHFKEDAKRAWEEVEQERIKTARAEANAKAANERFEAVEEVQRSTFQMLLDLQRQFGELQRRI